MEKTNEINQLQKSLAHSKSERKKTLAKMKQLQEEVVRPLIGQVVERDQTIARLKADKERLQYNLKMLHAILRSPKLCDLYNKRMRKTCKERDIKQAN